MIGCAASLPPMAKRNSNKTNKPSKTSSTKSSRSKSTFLAKDPGNGASGSGSFRVSSKQFLSDKVGHFTESVIREMTRQAMLHSAVNLAQGFPDFPAPAEIKQAAQQAVAA